MTAKGHVVLAITPLNLVYGLGVLQHPFMLLAVIVGSLLPDIDELTEFLETGEILSMEKRYLERHFSKGVHNKMRELEERIAVLEEHRKNKK